MEEQNTMNSDASQAALSREKLEQHVRARAWKDDAFRQELLTDPKAILERDYAQWFPEGKIPSNLSFKILEEEEQTLCFVLPPKAPETLLKEKELNIHDFSLVAGGGLEGSKNTCSTSCYSCGYSNCHSICTGARCEVGSQLKNPLNASWKR